MCCRCGRITWRRKRRGLTLCFLSGSSAGFGWVSWRVLLLFSCICAALLDTHYSASIVTSLLLPPPKTIDSLRDLIDSSLDVGVVTDSYARDYFQVNTIYKLRFYKRNIVMAEEVSIFQLTQNFYKG